MEKKNSTMEILLYADYVRAMKRHGYTPMSIEEWRAYSAHVNSRLKEDNKRRNDIIAENKKRNEV